MSLGCFVMLRNQVGCRAALASEATTSHEPSPSGKSPSTVVFVSFVFALRVVTRTTGNPILELGPFFPERRYMRIVSLLSSLKSVATGPFVGTDVPRLPRALTRIGTSGSGDGAGAASGD